MAYNKGDRVECLDLVADTKFYGKIVAKGKDFFGKDFYDVKREDGETGIGVKSSWRIKTNDEGFGGRIVRRRPHLKS